MVSGLNIKCLLKYTKEVLLMSPRPTISCYIKGNAHVAVCILGVECSIEVPWQIKSPIELTPYLDTKYHTYFCKG